MNNIIRNELIERILNKVDRYRYLRDDYGWPSPKTIGELRNDPRAILRNSPTGKPEKENIETAIALMFMVEEDRLINEFNI